MPLIDVNAENPMNRNYLPKVKISFAINLFLICQNAFGVENHRYTNFQPFLDCDVRDAIREVGALPQFVPISRDQIKEIFIDFVRGETLEEMTNVLKQYSIEFFSSQTSSAWQKSNYQFGIFGGNKATHKPARLIHGIDCKMCLEFCDWIFENKKDELESMPQLKQILNSLIMLDGVCQKVFLNQVEQLAKTNPEIQQIFYNYKNQPRLPVSIRLIRFDQGDHFTMPLHFDNSIFTLIFCSDDDPKNESLLVAPANGSPFRDDQLRQVLRPISENLNESCALVISGTFLADLNIPIYPTPHCVIPHKRDSRCVIIACLHIPNHDSSKVDTVFPILTEVPHHIQQK